MGRYTKQELDEAVRAVASMIHKSEKAQLRLKPGSWQHAMTARALHAYAVAMALLAREQAAPPPGGTAPDARTREELEAALETLRSVCGRVERAKPKFAAGTPQHTLAVRRIRALEISSSLLRAELDGRPAGD